MPGRYHEFFAGPKTKHSDSERGDDRAQKRQRSDTGGLSKAWQELVSRARSTVGTLPRPLEYKQIRRDQEAVRAEFDTTFSKAVQMDMARQIATKFDGKTDRQKIARFLQDQESALNLLSITNQARVTFDYYVDFVKRDLPTDRQPLATKKDREISLLSDQLGKLLQRDKAVKPYGDISIGYAQKALFHFALFQNTAETLAVFPKADLFLKWFTETIHSIYTSDAPIKVKRQMDERFRATLSLRELFKGYRIKTLDTGAMNAAAYGEWMAAVYRTGAASGYSGPSHASVLEWKDGDQEYENWKASNKGTVFEKIKFSELKRFYTTVRARRRDFDWAKKALIFFAHTGRDLQATDKRFEGFSSLWRPPRPTADDPPPSSSEEEYDDDDDDDDDDEDKGEKLDDEDDALGVVVPAPGSASGQTEKKRQSARETAATDPLAMTPWEYFGYLVETTPSWSSDAQLNAWLREMSIVLSDKGKENAKADGGLLFMTGDQLQKARMMMINDPSVEFSQAIQTFGSSETGGDNGDEALKGILEFGIPKDDSVKIDEALKRILESGPIDSRIMLFANSQEAEDALSDFGKEKEVGAEEFHQLTKTLYAEGLKAFGVLTNKKTSLEDFYELVKEYDTGYEKAPMTWGPREVEKLLTRFEKETNSTPTSLADAKWGSIYSLATRTTTAAEGPPPGEDYDLFATLYNRIRELSVGIFSEFKWQTKYLFETRMDAEKALLFFAAKKPDYSAKEVFRMFGAERVSASLSTPKLAALLDDIVAEEDYEDSGADESGSDPEPTDEVQLPDDADRSNEQSDDEWVEGAFEDNDDDADQDDVELNDDDDKEDEFSSEEGEEDDVSSEEDNQQDTVFDFRTNLEEILSSDDDDDDDAVGDAQEELNEFVRNLFNAKKAKNGFRVIAKGAGELARRRNIEMSAAEIRALVVSTIRAKVVGGEEDDETVDREFRQFVDTLVTVYIETKFKKLVAAVKQKAVELNLDAEDETLISAFVVDAISEYFGDLDEEEEAEQDVVMGDGSDDDGEDNVTLQDLEVNNKEAVMAGIDKLIRLNPLLEGADFDEHVRDLALTTLYYYGNSFDEYVGELIDTYGKLPGSFNDETWAEIAESGVYRGLTDDDEDDVSDAIREKLLPASSPADEEQDPEITAALILARGDLEEAFALLNIQ